MENFEELTDKELAEKKSEAWVRYQKELMHHDNDMAVSRAMYVYKQLEKEWKKRVGGRR